MAKTPKTIKRIKRYKIEDVLTWVISTDYTLRQYLGDAAEEDIKSKAVDKLCGWYGVNQKTEFIGKHIRITIWFELLDPGEEAA